MSFEESFHIFSDAAMTISYLKRNLNSHLQVPEHRSAD
jgi:hypothetical protein